MLPDEHRSIVLRLSDDGMTEVEIVVLLYDQQASKFTSISLIERVHIYQQVRSDVHNFLILNKGVTGDAFDSDRPS